MSLPPNRNLLKEYPNKTYIETGIWRGDSIQFAVEAGFENIIGIDNDMECINFCSSRFDLKNHNGKWMESFIRLYLGDSATSLAGIMANIKTSVTLFLDSHTQWLEDEPFNPNPFPLLDELKQITEHHIKSSTIIIDDILILTHPNVTGWSRKTIEDAVLAINPAYKFQYVANPVKQNLLICII